MGIGTHQSTNAKSVEWITPSDIIKKIGRFALDPCASEKQPWPTAEFSYTKSIDGLLLPWSGSVWLNPPYGSELGKWMKRLRDHNDGIALIFARTETKVFFDCVWSHAESILFIKGRITFHLPDGSKAKGNSGGPSVLIAYGKKCSDMLKASGITGRFIGLKNA